MAELDTSEKGGKKKGKGKRSKKMSTRVDLTPMVDLAFLLVTFFMLTTTFAKPQTMEINMPVKDKTHPEEVQDVKASKTMTVILTEGDRIYWYMGIKDPQVELSNYSAKGIRQVLLEKNRSITDFICIIKPTDQATYKNVVDILDEMNIVGVQRYALVDITPVELDLIKNSPN